MRRAIQVRAEAYAFFFHLAQLAQAEDLETAGVGEQGPVPAHELVQPAQLAHQLVPRPKVQVIGISQNDLRAQVFQDVLRDRFDSSGRADRHECRRFHAAVRGVNAAQAGRTGLGLNGEGKDHTDYGTGSFRKFRAKGGSCFLLNAAGFFAANSKIISNKFKEELKEHFR